jgi:hypothetical protein
LSRDPAAEIGANLNILDPFKDASSAYNLENLYRFIYGNPLTETDDVGLWPSSTHPLGWLLSLSMPHTHQHSIRRAIPGLSDHDYELLDDATVEVDQGQGTVDSYQHAMAAPNQSKADARRQANNFVRMNLVLAKFSYCGCLSSDRDAALHYFGLALHTIQDSTSPAHAGFQTWYGEDHPVLAYAHLIKEDYDPGAGSHLDKATAWFWKLFDCSVGIYSLPPDYFGEPPDPVGPYHGPAPIF